MRAEILLAAETEYVEREEAPRLIADALHPSGPHSDGLALLKAACEEEHAAKISQAISNGKIRILSPISLLPAGELHVNPLIPIDDFARYTIELGILVKFKSKLTPIGLIAHEAAEREHPPVAGEGGRRGDIRNALRETTAKDFLRRLTEYLRQGTLQAVNPINGAPYDSALPHLDPADPLWSVNETGRLQALELIGQLRRSDEGRRGNVTLQSAAMNKTEARDEAREFRDRQARGLFTLAEAAQIVADANGLSARGLLEDLHFEIKKGQLKTRNPDTLAPADRDNRQKGVWVLPADLDALFAAWGVEYRFPTRDGAGSLSGRAGSAQESVEQRRKRLQAQYDDLKAKGIKDYARRVAAGEGITPSRLRQLLSEGKKSAKPKAKKRSPFDY